jgi:hypothetical protein
VPAAQQPAIVAGVRACLTGRVAATDPSVQPASCRTAGSAQLVVYAEKTVRAGFRDATVRSVGVALALIILAFAMAFLLPKELRPEGAGH